MIGDYEMYKERSGAVGLKSADVTGQLSSTNHQCVPGGSVPQCSVGVRKQGHRKLWSQHSQVSMSARSSPRCTIVSVAESSALHQENARPLR
jgi:hypothetical protein